MHEQSVDNGQEKLVIDDLLQRLELVPRKNSYNHLSAASVVIVDKNSRLNCARFNWLINLINWEGYPSPIVKLVGFVIARLNEQ